MPQTRYRLTLRAHSCRIAVFLIIASGLALGLNASPAIACPFRPTSQCTRDISRIVLSNDYVDPAYLTPQCVDISRAVLLRASGTHPWSAGIRYIVDAELKAGVVALHFADDKCAARLWHQAVADQVSYEGNSSTVGTGGMPNQGLLFFIDHQPASALSWYEHAYEGGFTEIDTDLEDPGYYIALVAALDAAKAGKYEEAERFFHKAATMAPAPDAAPTDVFFFRGAIANAKGDVVEARRQWSASITSLRLDGLSPRYSALWGLNSAYLWMATAPKGRL